jgi:mycothiol system anti-sigma-R factor
MSEHCDEALAHLYRYLDGELDDATIVRKIQAHLVDCPPCGGAYEFEQRLKVVVRRHLSEDVPVALMVKLKEIVQSHQVD